MQLVQPSLETAHLDDIRSEPGGGDLVEMTCLDLGDCSKAQDSKILHAQITDRTSSLF